jgi:hypothetical protein
MAKSSYRMPKSVVGVKLPKAVRKFGEDVMASPLARAMLIEALVLVSAALVQSRTRRRASQAGSVGSNAASALTTMTSDASTTLGRAIDGMVGYIRRGTEEVSKPQASTRRGRKPKSRSTKARANGRRKSAAEHRLH